MQFNPKLKKAIQAIRAILDESDIAGVVVLQESTYSEYIFKVDPSYSCAKVIEGGIQVKNTDEGLTEKQRKQQAIDTANMLYLLSTTTGRLSLPLMETAAFLDKHLGIERGPIEHFSIKAFNN